METRKPRTFEMTKLEPQEVVLDWIHLYKKFRTPDGYVANTMYYISKYAGGKTKLETLVDTIEAKASNATNFENRYNLTILLRRSAEEAYDAATLSSNSLLHDTCHAGANVMLDVIETDPQFPEKVKLLEDAFEATNKKIKKSYAENRGADVDTLNKQLEAIIKELCYLRQYFYINLAMQMKLFPSLSIPTHQIITDYKLNYTAAEKIPLQFQVYYEMELYAKEFLTYKIEKYLDFLISCEKKKSCLKIMESPVTPGKLDTSVGKTENKDDTSKVTNTDNQNSNPNQPPTKPDDTQNNSPNQPPTKPDDTQNNNDNENDDKNTDAIKNQGEESSATTTEEELFGELSKIEKPKETIIATPSNEKNVKQIEKSNGKGISQSNIFTKSDTNTNVKKGNQTNSKNNKLQPNPNHVQTNGMKKPGHG